MPDTAMSRVLSDIRERMVRVVTKIDSMTNVPFVGDMNFLPAAVATKDADVAVKVNYEGFSAEFALSIDDEYSTIQTLFVYLVYNLFLPEKANQIKQTHINNGWITLQEFEDIKMYIEQTA